MDVFAMLLTVAMAKIIFRGKESNVAIVATFRLEIGLQEVFSRSEMSFFRCLIWTMNIAILAVEWFVFGLIVDSALLARFPALYGFRYMLLDWE